MKLSGGGGGGREAVVVVMRVIRVFVGIRLSR